VTVGHAAITTAMRYIHHQLDELAKAATVLASGGEFDPKVGARVIVSPSETACDAVKSETVNWLLRRQEVVGGGR